MVNVIYTGAYPSTCMGQLIVQRDGQTIYETGNVFHSTGSVRFDSEWNAMVEHGELEWSDDEAKAKFKAWLKTQPDGYEILEFVEEVLSSMEVCCGGCI